MSQFATWCSENVLASVLLAIIAAIAAQQLVRLLVRKCGRTAFAKSPHVFITGGSQGLGYALALELVLRGCRVTIMARREAVLREAVESIKATAAKTLPKSAMVAVAFEAGDVTDAEAVKACVGRAVERFGTVGCLICAAGSAKTGYFRDISASEFEWGMKLNFGGVVNSIKAVEPDMRRMQSGRIVVVSSALALTGYVGYSAYCPTKWALRGLCESLRNELLPYNVKMHIAYPGNMDTPGFEIENKTKPAEAKAIEEGESTHDARAVAKALLSEIDAGQFHLAGGDFGIDLLTRTMSGMSPRTNTVLEAVLIMPIAVIVGVIYRGMWDREVTKPKYRVPVTGENYQSTRE